MYRCATIAAILACGLFAQPIHVKAIECVVLDEQAEQRLRQRLTIGQGNIVTDADLIKTAKTVAAFDPTLGFAVGMEPVQTSTGEQREATIRISGAGRGPAVYYQPPQLKHKVDVMLPPDAPPEGSKSYAALSIIVERDGSVRNAGVPPIPPLPAYDAAVAAVEQWTYEPARSNREPVQARISVQVNFSFADGTPVSSPKVQQAQKSKL